LSDEASAGDSGSTPAKPAVQFRSFRPEFFWLAGSKPVPIQIIPCCLPRVIMLVMVLDLSPSIAAELVKPATVWSCHRRIF
jgi:hypothetical protein